MVRKKLINNGAFFGTSFTNLKIQNTNQFAQLSEFVSDYAVDISFNAHNLKPIHSTAQIDSWATDNRINTKCLSSPYLKNVISSNCNMVGIGNIVIKPKGQIKVDLVIGGIKFQNIIFMVVDSLPVESIIGRKILCERMSSWNINNTNQTMSFECYGNGPSSASVKLIKHPRKILTSFGINPIELPLDEKIKYIQEQWEVSLPKDFKDPDMVEKFANLIIEKKDVFHYEGRKMGCYPESVLIKASEPAYTLSYKISVAHHGKMKKIIEQVEKDGVIEICKDPRGFNTPIFAVGKKDGGIRMVSNFRKVNKVLLEEDPFQGPSAESLFQNIPENMEYFGTVDLASGYWQIPLKKECRHITAFQFGDKTYQYVVIPQGLKTSGAIFSRCVSKVIQPLKHRERMLAYIDDISSYSKTFEEYYETWENLFDALIKNNLVLKGKKCTFLSKQVTFLGRIIDTNGIKADPDHIQGVLSLKPPTNKRELQAVIGNMVWLRSYVGTRIGEKIDVTNFSDLIKSMTAILRKKVFSWTEDAQVAFDLVKSRLSAAPIISYADFKLPFVLITDASQTGIGAVLIQVNGDKQKIIAVGSKTLSDVQQRWSTVEREAYALYFFIEKYSSYLLGKPFVV